MVKAVIRGPHMSVSKVRREELDTKPLPTRYFSKKQETIVADDVSGQRVKNSGATMFDKGDVKTSKFLIECKTKTTAASSVSIKKEWLDKIKEEACFQGKEFTALAFNFEPQGENYYIIDKFLFSFLLESLK